MTNQDEARWWQTGVIYQIYPRSFMDANGDGIGDLPGILDRLDYLSDTLGVDAVWLSPFYRSPMADFGYDVADYTDVDPMFGTLADFDRLAAAVHARGLKLIVDFVPNHSSDQHPWFVASRSSQEDPKRDWYVWADAKPDGGPPNNWLSVFGGPAWTWDAATGQYYLHSFLKEQPDLNWRNPAVKAAMLDAMRFWLERGVDGFRIDVAHFMMKDPAMRDNPPAPGGVQDHKSLGAYDSQRHLYDKGHPDIHPLYREIRALLDAYSNEHPRFSVGETHIFDWDEWAAYYGEGDELHMPFNFALLKPAWDAKAIRAVVDGLEAAIPAHGWPNYVLGNHDERRLASRYGAAEARVAATLLLTLRGTPTLYYGDELGMAEAVIPPNQQQDPWGIRVPGLGRDGCRTPMQWDATEHAGFTDGTPWLPVQPDAQTVNVAHQWEDAGSMLNLYRRLLALRRATPALQTGAYAPLDDVPTGCFAYHRTTDAATMLIALNFTDAPLTLDSLSGDIVFSTNGARSLDALAGPLTLDAHEAVIVQV